MTIEDKIKEMLVEHGMFENDATVVVGRMKADGVHKSMAHRWNDDIEGYPLPLLAALWVEAKRTALKYIDTNCPKASFRPMFVQPVANGRGR
jgi:hypothetical protein